MSFSWPVTEYMYTIYNYYFFMSFSIGRVACYKTQEARKKYRLESLNLENALFIFRFSKVLDVVISQNFILVIDQFFMFITFLLFLDHYFFLKMKRNTRVFRKWNRSVREPPLYLRVMQS